MDERYSIEVNESYVEICGEITIEEAFDFINFFEKKGFKSLRSGFDEDCIICMSRTAIEEKIEHQKKIEAAEDEKFYEKLYEESTEKNHVLQNRIMHLESLIKDLMTEEKIKQSRILRENEELKRCKQILELSKDPLAIKAVEHFQKSDRLSRPMTPEEIEKCSEHDIPY